MFRIADNGRSIAVFWQQDAIFEMYYPQIEQKIFCFVGHNCRF